MAKPNNGNAVAILMKLKPGVTRGEVRELAALLERLGDESWLKSWREYGAKAYNNDPETPGVYKYNDEHGDPCFYIP